MISSQMAKRYAGERFVGGSDIAKNIIQQRTRHEHPSPRFSLRKKKRAEGEGETELSRVTNRAKMLVDI